MNYAEPKVHHKNKAKNGRECLSCRNFLKCGICFGYSVITIITLMLGIITSFTTIYGVFWCAFKERTYVPINYFYIKGKRYEQLPSEATMADVESIKLSERAVYTDNKFQHFIGIALSIPYIYIVILFFTSYFQALFSDPGKCPFPEEYYSEEQLKLSNGATSIPICRKCGRLKPSRAHHDSSSGNCILKFDHSCPFTAGALGFYNYGYFLKFITAGSVATVISIILQIIALSWKVRLYGGVEKAVIKFFLSFVGILFSITSAISVIMMLTLHWPMVITNETTTESFDNETLVEISSRQGFKWISPFSYENKRNNIREVMGKNYVRAFLIPFYIIRPLGDPMNFIKNAQAWDELEDEVSESVPRILSWSVHSDCSSNEGVEGGDNDEDGVEGDDIVIDPIASSLRNQRKRKIDEEKKENDKASKLETVTEKQQSEIAKKVAKRDIENIREADKVRFKQFFYINRKSKKSYSTFMEDNFVTSSNGNNDAKIEHITSDEKNSKSINQIQIHTKTEQCDPFAIYSNAEISLDPEKKK